MLPLPGQRPAARLATMTAFAGAAAAGAGLISASEPAKLLRNATPAYLDGGLLEVRATRCDRSQR